MVKMLEAQREYICTRCKSREVVNADIAQNYVINPPVVCSGTGKPCKFPKFELIQSSTVCKDYQEIKIQEQVQKLRVGSIPRSIVLLLEDDLVDTCKPGDDVVVLG
jgi:DNA helicase MCM9